MISQLFIQSARGDVIAYKDYLGNVTEDAPEIFFRNIKFWKGTSETDTDCPPVFCVDGVSYLYIEESAIAVVATSRENVNPSLILEFLKALSMVLKDYIGSFTEAVLRKNFHLVYEVLDEAVDYGYPQSTCSEDLKKYILNMPIEVSNINAPPQINPFAKRIGPIDVRKSVMDTMLDSKTRRDEIFLDIIESATCSFSGSNGSNITRCLITGQVVTRCFLAGNPNITVALSNDLVVATKDGGAGPQFPDGNGVYLDDCVFNDMVNTERFATDRVLTMRPQDGQHTLMTYRMDGQHAARRLPFQVFSMVEEEPNAQHKAVMYVRLRSNYTSSLFAQSLAVEVCLPSIVERVHCQVPPNTGKDGGPEMTTSWQEPDRMVVWRIARFKGGMEAQLRIKLTLSRPYSSRLKHEVGPVNVNFSIPQHSLSGMRIKSLSVQKADKNYKPARWVRYLSSSDSYQFRP